ncbi:MAG: hypothetical protein KDD64_01270 [Bdellovibrionales bacterium]|nr:hypothetical protein [Bdellovibrionales bacterium]
MHYRPPKSERSKVFTFADIEQPRSFTFMVTFVYFPLLLVVLTCRATMLYFGYRFIDLKIVDQFLAALTRELFNFLAPFL